VKVTSLYAVVQAILKVTLETSNKQLIPCSSFITMLTSNNRAEVNKCTTIFILLTVCDTD